MQTGNMHAGTNIHMLVLLSMSVNVLVAFRICNSNSYMYVCKHTRTQFSCFVLDDSDPFLNYRMEVVVDAWLIMVVVLSSSYDDCITLTS